MSYRIVEIIQSSPLSQAEIIPSTSRPPHYLFGTGSEDKLSEYAEVLGRPVDGRPMEVDEIQETDLRKIVEDKAIRAWEKNGRQPIIVEDVSLEIHGWGGNPGPHIKWVTQTVKDRQVLCDIAHQSGDTRASFRVMFGVFDGKEVHIREGTTDGTITKKPRGSRVFGFDDIFEPDGQETEGELKNKRTFSEMTLREKANPRLSPRTKALLKLRDEPIMLGKYAYRLPEPYQMQLEAIDGHLLDDELVRKYALDLKALEDGKPRDRYYEIDMGGDILRYVTDLSTSDLGIIVTPIDRARNMKGKPLRMQLGNDDQPVFWQVGPEATRMAVAARAFEFKLHHNPEMYERIRKMLRGEIKTSPRSNKRSPVIERLIGMFRENENVHFAELEANIEEAMEVYGTAGLAEIGYARVSSDERQLSRTKASREGLFVTSSGIPTALFSLGDMPSVGGWRDVLVTAALSYMDSYIPRNSIYANNVDLQLKLFSEAQKQIQKLGLPKDIEELCIAHIGILVGCDNPQQVAGEVARMYKEGVRSIRIASTNPGKYLLETAYEIRRICPQTDLRLCVGTITDFKQAQALIAPNIHVNKILIGHGGGENCTSLSGGGAANSMELLYKMSIDKRFNNTSLGLEGGTGDSFGGILGMVDNISLNRRGVAGGIELGGLFVELVNGKVGQPYPGSASPGTQWTEAITDSGIHEKRVDKAGRLINNEGKIGYVEKHQATNSIVDLWHYVRMLAGRALADQDAMSLSEIRGNIAKHGYRNLRSVSQTAYAIAQEHR